MHSLHLRAQPRRIVFVLVFLAAIISQAVGSTEGLVHAQPIEVIGKQRVLLIPMKRQEGVSSVVPGRVFEYMRTILEMNDNLEVFEPDTLEVVKVDESKKVVEVDPKLVAADKSLWRAKELADKGRHEAAMKAFKRARGLYESRMSELVDFDKYVDASLGVALSQFRMSGEDARAEAALVPVLAWRPNLLFDKRKDPPAAIKSLDKLKFIATKTAADGVRVEANVAGAEVYLDGVKIGEAPVTLPGVVEGRHWVRVIKEGHKSWADSFKTTGRRMRTLKARLPSLSSKTKRTSASELSEDPAGLERAAQTGRFGRGFKQLAMSISNKYRLDAILLSYIRPGKGDYEAAVFLFDGKRKQVAELERLSFDTQLANMQVVLLSLEERVLRSLAVFPSSRVLRRRSEIYDAPEPEPEPEPVVMAEAVVSPAISESTRTEVEQPSPEPSPPSRKTHAVSPTPVETKREVPRTSSAARSGRDKATVAPVQKSMVIERQAPEPWGVFSEGSLGQGVDLKQNLLRDEEPHVLGKYGREDSGNAPPQFAPSSARSTQKTETVAPSVKEEPQLVEQAAEPTPQESPAPASSSSVAPQPAPVQKGRSNAQNAPSVPRRSEAVREVDDISSEPTAAPEITAINPMVNSEHASEDWSADQLSTEPWYEKWWVWTIVGATVIGGATAAGVLLAPSDDTPGSFRARVQWAQ